MAVLVVGGGGKALASHLGIEGVPVAPDPVYANAIGFAAWARVDASRVGR